MRLIQYLIYKTKSTKKKDMYDFVVTNNEKIDVFRTKLNSILEKISH